MSVSCEQTAMQRVSMASRALALADATCWRTISTLASSSLNSLDRNFLILKRKDGEGGGGGMNFWINFFNYTIIHRTH